MAEDKSVRFVCPSVLTVSQWFVLGGVFEKGGEVGRMPLVLTPFPQGLL